MSRYFDWTTSLKRFIRFDTARAEDVNDAFDELSAGLDNLDVDVDRAIKLPSGSNEISQDGPARANKVFTFGPSGEILLIPLVEVPDAVARSGDTMTGPLLLHADPSASMQAATKQYVDNKPGTPDFILQSQGVI